MKEMTTTQKLEPWTPTTEPRASRHFFLLLLATAFVALCFLVKPLAPVLLFAAVLASSLTPLYNKLTARMGNHRQASAIVFVLVFFIVVLAPILAAVASAVNDAVTVSQSVSEQLEKDGINAIILRLPPVLQERVLALDLDTVALREKVGEASGKVLTATGMFLKATGDAIFALVMLLIALIVFLTDGPRIVQWLDDVMPLERGQTHEIFREFRKISTSVIVGNFGTSAIQSLVALAGYFIAGAPSPLVLGIITFLMSFVPAVGGAGVCLLVGGGLLLAGKTGMGIFLCIWAIAVVGIVDNVVKPKLVKRGVRLHGALVFFAIIAGIAAFGASGLLLGPLIVTFALTLIRIYKRDFKADVSPGNGNGGVDSPPAAASRV
jgi:predicted PurR-regulated permease PerM